MKKEEKLKISYQKQKEQFESSRAKKLDNIAENVKNLEKKVHRIQQQIAQLKESEQKVLQKNFPSFEEFFRSALQQRQSSKNQ